jgi:hypothetical protein
MSSLGIKKEYRGLTSCGSVIMAGTTEIYNSLEVIRKKRSSPRRDSGIAKGNLELRI